MWAISNLCRGKPQPELSHVIDCVPAIAYVLERSSHAEIRSDCFWALSYLSDGDDYRIQAVIDGNVIPYGIEAVQSTNSSLVTPALRFLGNIVTGSTEQTQMVLDAGILDVALKLLQHPRVSIVLHMCVYMSRRSRISPCVCVFSFLS